MAKTSLKWVCPISQSHFDDGSQFCWSASTDQRVLSLVTLFLSVASSILAVDWQVNAEQKMNHQTVMRKSAVLYFITYLVHTCRWYESSLRVKTNKMMPRRTCQVDSEEKYGNDQSCSSTIFAVLISTSCTGLSLESVGTRPNFWTTSIPR